MGDEVLDGENILNQMESALANREMYLEKADEYEAKKDTANPIIDLYYSWKVHDYMRLAELSQKLYEEWKRKSDKYDEIDSSTSVLFSTTSSLREAITTALNSMNGRFQNGVYMPQTSSDWKTIIEMECFRLKSCMNTIKTEWTAGQLADVSNKDQFIKLMQNVYGFDDDTGEILYKLYQGIDNQHKDHEEQIFSALLASFCYGV